MNLTHVAALEGEDDIRFAFGTLSLKACGAIARRNIMQTYIVFGKILVHLLEHVLIQLAFTARIDDDRVLVFSGAASKQQRKAKRRNHNSARTER